MDTIFGTLTPITVCLIFDTVQYFTKAIASKEIFRQIRCYLALPESPLGLTVSQVAKSIPN